MVITVQGDGKRVDGEVAAILVVFALLALRYAWNCDDAFIAFRYGRNLAEGLGLRYNVGGEQTANIRLDYGWGDGDSGLYIRFGEAF